MSTFWDSVDKRFLDLEPYIGKLDRSDYSLLSEAEFVELVPNNLKILMLVFLRSYASDTDSCENQPALKLNQNKYLVLKSDKGFYSNCYPDNRSVPFFSSHIPFDWEPHHPLIPISKTE